MREDWEEVEIAKIARLYQPKTISSKSLIVGGKYLVYGANGVIGNYDSFNHADSELIITCRGATCGNVHITKPKSWINGNAMVVKPLDKSSIYIGFLKYIFSNSRRTKSAISGSAQPQITRASLSKVLIPIAPLPEQRAIVAKIEALFSDLDKAEAELKKAQEQLKVYRQAVLKKAFEGELTREWREKQLDLPSAEELLIQIKEERLNLFKQQEKVWKQELLEVEGSVLEGKKPAKPRYIKEVNSYSDSEILEFNRLPSNWIWVKSGEIFNYITSGSRGWAKYYSNNGGIFIRITNLNFDTLDLDLSAKSIQYVNPPETAEGLRTKVQKGDFLFSITGYLGMFAIAPDLEEAYVNQHVSLARPSNLCNRKYLGYWIISKTGGHYYLNEKSKGATKAGLGLDDISEFPIPLCTSLEQHQIVCEIESRLSVCDKLEQSVYKSLENIIALRQSILKKAFEGALLSEAEIETCKMEPDWEPASALLERIRNSK